MRARCRPTFASVDAPFLPNMAQARRDSNPQPPVLETGALPVELRDLRPSASTAGRKPVDGQGRNRTADTTIFSRVLYQLSYLAEKKPEPSARAGVLGVSPDASGESRSPDYAG